MAVYAPGKSVFDLVGPPGAELSWDAYREAWTHFFAMFSGPVHYTISELDVAASGDIGYGRSLQHVSGMRKDGKPYDITARVTDVYRKINGKWLIVQEHASLALDRKTFTPILHSSLPANS
jgi:ketosteroid isomerase-like protein